MCDKKGPTLILVKSKQQQKFGAYISIEIMSDEEYYKDDKAFIFSLSKYNYSLSFSLN